MYAVVEFSSRNSISNEIAIVPLSWFTKGEKRCYWPTKIRGAPLNTFIKELNPAERHWAHYPIYRVHLKTESYEAAEEAISKLIHESELSAAGSGSGTIIRRTMSNESTTSSEDELILPLRKKKRALDRSIRDTPNKENQNEENLILTYQHEGVVSPGPSSTSTITNSTNKSDMNDLSIPLDFQNTVLSTMAGLQTTSNQILLTMQEILRINKQISLDKLVSPENLPSFPLKTTEEFEQFEKLLEEDQVVNQYMVRRLAALGGSGVEGVTRRIMKFLMINYVGLQFNWKGRYNKMAFENTKIMPVIYEAAKLNFPVNEKNDKNIAFAVKEWLKHSSTRIAQARQSEEKRRNKVND